VELHAILSARRAYEFGADDIRLTTLCHREVVTYLMHRYSFEAGDIATPPETFGPVPPTFPAGLALATGSFDRGELGATNIRMVTVEARRIVIDIVGPSEDIAAVFQDLNEALSIFKTYDGSPAIGTPISVRDVSEISFTSSGLLSSLVRPELLQVVNKYANHRNPDVTSAIVPLVRLRLQDFETEYPGNTNTDPDSFVIDLRGGSTLERELLFSSAPLETSAHLDLIRDLESALQPA